MRTDVRNEEMPVFFNGSVLQDGPKVFSVKQRVRSLVGRDLQVKLEKNDGL